MPRLLRPSAVISSFGETLYRLTARGTAMPCSFPSVLIHIHLALWMWPAIIRTVRRGAPGTVAPHSSWGKCSTRKTVTRLLVLHAASRVSRWSSADFITSLHKMIKPTPNVRADRARRLHSPPDANRIARHPDASGLWSNDLFGATGD